MMICGATACVVNPTYARGDANPGEHHHDGLVLPKYVGNP